MYSSQTLVSSLLKCNLIPVCIPITKLIGVVYKESQQRAQNRTLGDSKQEVTQNSEKIEPRFID